MSIDAVRPEPASAADEDAVPVDGASDAVPGRLLRAFGQRQLEAALLGPGDERSCERMCGETLERGGEPQRFISRQAVEEGDVGELRPAERDRPSLVEQDRARLAQPLDRPRALDHDPGAGRAGEAGHQRDRRGEDERARGGDDEDGERTDGIPGDRPGGAGDQGRRRQEERRVAVGHAHERRPLALRLLHQPNQRRVSALGGGTQRTHLEGRPGAGGAAPHLAAPMRGHRQRLAGQRRFVDDGLVAQDETVDRDNLARANEHDISRDDVVDRHRFQAILATDERHPRRPLDERAQLAPRAPVGHLLERVAAREHERDHRPGEVLAEGERAGHRDERDRIHADIAAHDHPRHRDRQRHEQKRRRGRPGQVRRRVDPEHVQHQPAHHAEQGKQREDPCGHGGG
jgi:hypothetical protein